MDYTKKCRVNILVMPSEAEDEILLNVDSTLKSSCNTPGSAAVVGIRDSTATKLRKRLSSLSSDVALGQIERAVRFSAIQASFRLHFSVISFFESRISSFHAFFKKSTQKRKKIRAPELHLFFSFCPTLILLTFKGWLRFFFCTTPTSSAL